MRKLKKAKIIYGITVSQQKAYPELLLQEPQGDLAELGRPISSGIQISNHTLEEQAAPALPSKTFSGVMRTTT